MTELSPKEAQDGAATPEVAESIPLEDLGAPSPYDTLEYDTPVSAAEDSTVNPPHSVPPPALESEPQAETADESSEEEGEEELGAKMTFLEHLDELRKRILYSVISLAVGFGVCWGFRETIMDFLKAPSHGVLKELNIMKVQEPFTFYMDIAFYGGIFVAAPFILLQVWMFVAPGLYRREKRHALPFLLSSLLLFLTGAFYGYFVILPPALHFLIVEFGRAFTPRINVTDYFNFVKWLLLGMGLIFQLPVIIAFLSLFGLITPRFLWRNFRYAFLLIVIAAAVLSPTTDPFSLFLWSVPGVALYMVGIVISWFFKYRRARREASG